MSEDYKKIAESVRSGKYFADAKGWYQAVYIGPISERSFFLIIAFLAALVAVFGFMSVKRLLPITKKEPVLIRAGERPEEVQTRLVQLAKNHAPINPAITDFFLTQYVMMREGFDARTFSANARFVRAQSNDAAYTVYALANDPKNPQSPFATLGEYAQRIVKVTDVKPAKSRDLPAGHKLANVSFTVETAGAIESTKSRWTANIEYIYTGLETKTVKNPETHEEELEITDPHFQVVNYVLTETK